MDTRYGIERECLGLNTSGKQAHHGCWRSGASLWQSTDKCEAPRRLCLSPIIAHSMSLLPRLLEGASASTRTQAPLFPCATPVYDTANETLPTGTTRPLCCLYMHVYFVSQTDPNINFLFPSYQSWIMHRCPTSRVEAIVRSLCAL